MGKAGDSTSLSEELSDTMYHRKALDWSKFKTIANNNLNVAEIAKFVFDRIDNIAENREKAGHQHFLLILQCFQKVTFSGSLKVGIES